MTALAEKTEEVCQLPTGWRMACVGDILKIRNGYAFKSTDYKEAGVPLIRQSELKSDVIDLSEAKRVDPAFLDELIKRDKVNLDIFWLKDEALEDSANLPAPGIIATEIVEDLRAALAQFEEIEADLKES